MPNSTDIHLKGWYAWEEAQKLPDAKQPGVYVLAHFSDPPNSIDLKDPRIVYIGETCGQTLRRRWRQFSTSAFSNKARHSGGLTYFAAFNGGRQTELFVAFATPNEAEPGRAYHIRYLERKWLHEFVVVHGQPPSCNRK